MRLSEQQDKAIRTIDQNVCVNAGAGSGKTEVLTRRFIKIYQEKNVPLNTIICITFTKKASAEMKDRIQSQLQQFPILREQIDLKVSTVHSFCRDLIARFSYDLDIDPRFLVMEESEKNSLIQKVLEDLFQQTDYQTYAFEAANVMDLKGVEEVKDFLLEILNTSSTFNQSLKKIEEWTVTRIESIEDFTVTDRIDLIHLFIEAIESLRSSKLKTKIMEKEAEIREGTLEITSDWIEEIVDRYKSVKAKAELKESILKLCHKFLAILEKDYIEFYKKTFQILQDIEGEIERRKKESGKVDFNDLERYTLVLLENPKIRKEIQSRISYIMIDEFQDTSDIQKEIFKRIVSDKKPYDRKNLFIVGDPKQAIYGFRGANIDIFETTRDEILRAHGVYITFEENFRSQKEIMEVVNDCYTEIMPSYDPLRAIRERKDKVAMIRWEDQTTEKFEQEAYEFAQSVTQDESKDYAVLFRTKKNFSVLENVLREKNIPFYSMGTENFESQFEVLDFLNFLHYYFYRDPISLIGILQNYYEMSHAEIYEFMHTSKLEKHPNSIDLDEFLVFLKEKSLHSKIAELVLEIIRKFELYDKYNEQGLGNQEQANLYQLFEIAIQFDQEGSRFKDYFDFLSHMKKITQKQLETEESKTVKLMTIHASKGLGFKNVYLPRINQSIKSMNTFFTYMNGQGIALNIPNACTSYLLLKEKIKLKEEKEEDNIYYTAMTRAKDKLVLGLSGNKGGYKKKILPMMDRLQSLGKIEPLQQSNQPIKREEEVIEIEDLQIASPSVVEKRLMSVTSFLHEENHPKEKILMTDNPTTSLDGEIIHRFAEIYDGDKKKALLKVFQEYGSIVKSKRFETYADCFIQMNNNKAEKIEKEVPFYIKIQEQRFSGIIDRVEHDKDGIRIIDYKLSNRDKDHLYKTYYLQLAFYGFVLNKKYHEKIYLELQNLKRNYKICFDYDTVKDEIEKKISSFVKEK